MIEHDIYLTCDAPDCAERFFLRRFDHKRQISVRELRELANPSGWVTHMGARGETSFCPKHKGDRA